MIYTKSKPAIINHLASQMVICMLALGIGVVQIRTAERVGEEDTDKAKPHVQGAELHYPDTRGSAENFRCSLRAGCEVWVCRRCGEGR